MARSPGARRRVPRERAPAAVSVHHRSMSADQLLVCPACGAPSPAEAAHQPTTCRFCGATRVPVPREVERVVEKVVVVGGPGPEPEGPGCPRCSRALEAVRSGARGVSVCTRCGGVWVDKDTADYLARVSDPDLEVAVRRSVGVVISVAPAQRVATVFCPVCDQATRHVDLPNTGQGIDVCDAHGTWFDRDELTLFVEGARDARAGEISGDDLGSAGVPQAGFFSRVFRALLG